MAGGRPPKHFTREECDELGKDLLKWIKENTQAVMWVEWYDEKGLFRSDWRSLIQRPEFLTHYEKARHIMVRNMMLNKNLAQSYGNRYLALYDDELRAHEKEIKEEEAKIKAAETKSFDQAAWDHVRSYLLQKPSEDKASEANHTDSQAGT